MDDSLMVARLTLMLMRASVQHPESLPLNYGVVILPSEEVLSQQQALQQLGRLTGPHVVGAAVQRGNLVLSIAEPSATQRQSLLVGATNFEEAIHGLNSQNDPNALVRVAGFGEETLVLEASVRVWLWAILCSGCSMSVGRPLSTDTPGVVAVLYLGP